MHEIRRKAETLRLSQEKRGGMRLKEKGSEDGGGRRAKERRVVRDLE